MLRGAVHVAIAVMAIATVGVAPAASADALTREQAVARALSENPEISTLTAEAGAAEGVLGADRRLLRTNPVAEGAIGPRFRSEGDTLDWSVGLRQELEIAGQRGDRIELCEAELEASRARLDARRVSLAAEVREAFGAAIAARERQQLAVQAVRLAEDALAAANERLKEGAGTRLEVNTARIEWGRALRERGVADGRLAEAKARLGLLVAMPQDASWEPTGELGGQIAAAAVRDGAAERRELVEAKREVEAAMAAVDLASAEAIPNVSVGANYREEEGDRIIQGTLAIPLPFFERNQEGKALAASRVRRAKARLAAVEREIAAQLAVALSRYETARLTVDAFGTDAVEALQQNLEMVNEAYRAGKIDFLQLLIVRRETLASQLAWVDAREDLDRAEAEVLRALGRIE